ncbi:phosphosulfolactate synthase [Coxiella burnetii]|uniref:phosphosulfolactate synthase n=1 Tax=Coxiella burnetii TaxID=777 RepID=UPI00307A3BF0
MGGGDFIDILKLGFGTSRIYSRKKLLQKLSLLKKAGIIVCPGGTFFEIAYFQNKIAEYFEACQQLGFNGIEISDGVDAIDIEMKVNFIKKAKQLGFTVFAEIGRKDPAMDAEYNITQRIPEASRQLAAGAWKIILEARESGTLGIYDNKKSVKETTVDTWLKELDAGSLLFEAPHKHQQAWLINRLGNQVNLANIQAKDVVGLECLRLGLRSDTFNLIRKCK